MVAQFGDVTDTLIGESGFDSLQKEVLKWQQRQTERRTLSNIEIKTVWHFTSTSSVVMACYFIKYRDNSTFFSLVITWPCGCSTAPGMSVAHRIDRVAVTNKLLRIN